MFRCVARGVKVSRKNGRYKSLSHERNIAQDLYSENLKKFFGFKNDLNSEVINRKIDLDGLTTLEYEVLEERSLSKKATLIRVKI
jgi:negative regulator of sigma E activity